MTARLASMMIAVALVLAGARAEGQPAGPPPPITLQTSPAQLDDLLAPIALYPDELLSQILMAASYPVEVVQADRWLQDPANGSLTDGALFTAVDQQDWDPSVKSLTPFPGILHMMDNHLEWTESLGEAFIANPAAVMNAVQDLRHRAMGAGALRSTPQLVVSVNGDIITIAAAAPPTIAYPAYDPTVAYGPWPYPDFPPYAFGDIFDGCAVGDFGYCWFDVAIVAPLWGWHHLDWIHHGITLDPGRFAALNDNRPPQGGSSWVHERGHRHGVPYIDADTRARYPGAVESVDPGRAARGYPVAPSAPAYAPRTPGGFVGAPTPRGPPSYESYGAGSDVRAQAQRGQASRMSVPRSMPSRAPSSSGRGPRS